MANMVSCINGILELILKSVAVLVIFLFVRVFLIDRKIENIEQDFEDKKKKELEHSKREGVVEAVYASKLLELRQVIDEQIAPLKRKRQRIISMIPFLK